jgi:hypothetical protein
LSEGLSEPLPLGELDREAIMLQLVSSEIVGGRVLFTGHESMGNIKGKKRKGKRENMKT